VRKQRNSNIILREESFAPHSEKPEV